MFSLVIVLVSIALVIVLALATIYYGGSIFAKGGDAAKAAQTINEGTQIKSAITLYGVETGNSQIEDLDVLVSSNHLRSVPQDWTLIDGYVAKAASSENECLEANTKQGVSTVPTCSELQTNPSYAGKALCCSYPAE